MDRRTFLQSSAVASAASLLPLRAAHASPDWRTFEIVTRVEFQWPKGASRAWIPLPLVEDNE